MMGFADVMRMKGGAPTLRSRKKKGEEKASEATLDEKNQKGRGTSTKRKGEETASPGTEVEEKKEGRKRRKAAEAEEKPDTTKSGLKTGRASRSKRGDTKVASQEGKKEGAVQNQAGRKRKRTEAPSTAKATAPKRGKRIAESTDKRARKGTPSKAKSEAGAKSQRAKQRTKEVATTVKETARATRKSGGRTTKKKESTESEPQKAAEGAQLGTYAKLERSPLIVFAHGAGAGASSAFMQRWRELLKEATGAVDVVTFDYPYLAGGKRGMPPKAEKLIDFHVDVIKEAQKSHVGCPLVLAGKSMGSRVSCMIGGLVESGLEVAAVVCLGYPLKGMGKGPIREQTLLDLKCPVIFVQGSRDSMCPLDLLEDVQSRMGVRNELHLVEGGDHGLSVSAKALKEQEKTMQQVEASALEAITSFLAQVT